MDQAICFHKFSDVFMYLCIRTRLFKKIPAFNLYILCFFNICCYKHCFILYIETSNHRQQMDCVQSRLYILVATGDMWNGCDRRHG